MSISESYEIAFDICDLLKKELELPEKTIIFPSAWYEGYFVVTVRDGNDEFNKSVLDSLEKIVLDYPEWVLSRHSTEANKFNVHFDKKD